MARQSSSPDAIWKALLLFFFSLFFTDGVDIIYTLIAFYVDGCKKIGVCSTVE